MTTKIALFASGSGSNAENIVNYFADKPGIEFPLIVSNKVDAYVHERARRLGIPSVTFSSAEFRDGNAILTILKDKSVNFIVLAGFLLKVSPPLLEAFPDKIINIHPALLPAYGGKGMWGHHVHEAVVAAGEKESGITVHYVNENYDEGAIVFQAKCEISAADSAETVAEKVHQLEYRYFPETIELIINGWEKKE